MVASIDGATAVAGVSGGLGGAADRRLFSVLRSLADTVLLAAGTLRAENYGPGTRPIAVVSALASSIGARPSSPKPPFGPSSSRSPTRRRPTAQRPKR
jgi:riboflavin biosynthesis pyrimidine reductase